MNSLSVVIPTCNRLDLLEKCLSSLRSSLDLLGELPFEVIVTDDGKTQPAKELVETRFSWATWREGPHRGPAANRNAGARLASHEWIAFVDDDCIPDPGWLKAFIDNITQEDQVLEGKTICRKPITSLLDYSPVNETGGYLWSCNMAILKSLFERLGGFDEKFPHPHMEDVDFRERILGQNVNIRFVEAAIVDHPPRKAVLGKRRAMMNESAFYFYSKLNRGNSFSPINFRLIVMGHLYCLLSNRHKSQKLTYINQAIIETWHIVINSRKWEQKYANSAEIESAIAQYRSNIDDRMFFRTRFTRKSGRI